MDRPAHRTVSAGYLDACVYTVLPYSPKICGAVCIACSGQATAWQAWASSRLQLQRRQALLCRVSLGRKACSAPALLQHGWCAGLPGSCLTGHAACPPPLPCLPSRHKSRHQLVIDKAQHEQALQGCVYAREQLSILWAALMLTSQQSSRYLTVLLDKRLLAKALMRPARRVSLIDIFLCRDLRHRHGQAACQPFTMGRQECKFITHRQGEYGCSHCSLWCRAQQAAPHARRAPIVRENHHEGILARGHTGGAESCRQGLRA